MPLMLKQLPPPPPDKKGWPWTDEFPVLPLLMPDGSEWPKISIVTPSYNQGEFIEETIRSILLQNYPNLEYIVIDGGSTDNSVEIIKKYGRRIHYWVSEEDKGQYDAINKGFSLSTGEIMLWMNSDDMLVQKSLYVLASIFLSHPETVRWVTGIQAYWDIKGNLFSILPYLRYVRLLNRLGCYDGRALHWIMQECTAWSRSLWQQSGAEVNANFQYAGDFELWLRFSKYADLYLVTTLIGANRQWPGQKTANLTDYYKEVDFQLRQSFFRCLFNRMFRIPIIKKVTRAYLVSTKNRFSINYDSKNMKWVLNDS